MVQTRSRRTRRSNTTARVAHYATIAASIFAVCILGYVTVPNIEVDVDYLWVVQLLHGASAFGIGLSIAALIFFAYWYLTET